MPQCTPTQNSNKKNIKKKKKNQLNIKKRKKQKERKKGWGGIIHNYTAKTLYLPSYLT
jgi:hypothetical protein